MRRHVLMLTCLIPVAACGGPPPPGSAAPAAAPAAATAAVTGPAQAASYSSLQALLDAEVPAIPARAGIWVKHLTTGEEGGIARR